MDRQITFKLGDITSSKKFVTPVANKKPRVSKSPKSVPKQPQLTPNNEPPRALGKTLANVNIKAVNDQVQAVKKVKEFQGITTTATNLGKLTCELIDKFYEKLKMNDMETNALLVIRLNIKFPANF